MESRGFVKEKPRRYQPNFTYDGCLWAHCFFFITFQFSGKNGLLAAISGNICLRNSQADFGVEVVRFRVVLALRLMQSTTAS